MAVSAGDSQLRITDSAGSGPDWKSAPRDEVGETVDAIESVLQVIRHLTPVGAKLRFAVQQLKTASVEQPIAASPQKTD